MQRNIFNSNVQQVHIESYLFLKHTFRSVYKYFRNISDLYGPTYIIIFFALQSRGVPLRGPKSMHEFIVLLI